MTYIISTFKGFFPKRSDVAVDPVYHFFLHASSRSKKRVYTRALKKAQFDQEQISKVARKKVRA